MINGITYFLSLRTTCSVELRQVYDITESSIFARNNEGAVEELTENLQFHPEEVNYQIGKCHRIGPRLSQYQRRYAIVDSPIQKPLLQRSCLFKNTSKNKKSNFLSHKEKKKTLTYAYNNADIHGNLKFHLKNAINNKFVYSSR